MEKEYVIEINNKFGILRNLEDEDSIDNDINEKWENIKTRIKEIKETAAYRKGRRQGNI